MITEKHFQTQRQTDNRETQSDTERHKSGRWKVIQTEGLEHKMKN